MGCPCHIAHNVASTAADAFRNEVGFNIEELVVNIFYWFDKSTKRNGSFEEHCYFCDVQYRKVIKYISTHWVSLEVALERALKLYAGLRSYFLSECSSEQRFIRMQTLSITEVYLLSTNSFRFQSLQPIFTKGGCTHSPIVHGCCEVNTDIANQLSDDNIFVGFVTRQTLLKLEREGSCSPSDSKNSFLVSNNFMLQQHFMVLARFRSVRLYFADYPPLVVSQLSGQRWRVDRRMDSDYHGANIGPYEVSDTN